MRAATGIDHFRFRCLLERIAGGGLVCFPSSNLDKDWKLGLEVFMSPAHETDQDRNRADRFISEELNGARLDKAVKVHFSLPWIKAKSWIDTGKIFVNGSRNTAKDHTVGTGDRIELRMSAPKKQAASALDPKEVLMFDEGIVIVNKPAGMMTVPHHSSEEVETLDRLTLDYLRAQDRGGKHNRSSLGVVHRIDKETSGLIVFARTFAAQQELSRQFRARTIERRYFAIVHGRMKKQTIRSRLARDAGDGLRGSVRPGSVNDAGEELGRGAVTHVEVVEYLDGATLVACRIETGRTHQIRIHLSEAGHPIVGEKVYIRNYKEALIPGYRVMLHAAELGFVHPITGESVSWAQPLPKDFKNRLRSLRLVGRKSRAE